MKELTSNKTLYKIAGSMRRAIKDYNLIEEGDHIAVGISGGKDSLALLLGMANLKKYFPIKFSLSAITADIGFSKEHTEKFSAIKKLCDDLEVPYYIINTNIYEIVFNLRKESNPCSLCANMRRGALNDECKKIGANKIALGHHKDDFIDTFIMSMLQESRLYTLQPNLYMDRSEITLIRPMIYVEEHSIKSLTSEFNLPVIASPCALDKTSTRQKVRDTISSIANDFPNVRDNIFSAITHPERISIVHKPDSKK